MISERRKNFRFIAICGVLYVTIDVFRIGVDQATWQGISLGILKGMINGAGALGLLYVILWSKKKISKP